MCENVQVVCLSVIHARVKYNVHSLIHTCLPFISSVLTLAVDERGLLRSFNTEKAKFFNMTGTKSDLDPQGPKNVHNLFNDVANKWVEQRSWSWNVTDSDKPVFDLINRGQVLDITVQKIIPSFWIGAICGWNFLFQVLFQTRWGYLICPAGSEVPLLPSLHQSPDHPYNGLNQCLQIKLMRRLFSDFSPAGWLLSTKTTFSIVWHDYLCKSHRRVISVKSSRSYMVVNS